MIDKTKLPESIWIQEGLEQNIYGINQDGNIKGMIQYIRSDIALEQKELFNCPDIDIKDAIEITSRIKYIDEDLKPIAKFIMDYASWNLHKDEWNQPVLEVPLFRVLDALVQKGKPYCEG